MERKNYRFTFARIETINLEFFYFHVHSRAPYIYLTSPQSDEIKATRRKEILQLLLRKLIDQKWI